MSERTEEIRGILRKIKSYLETEKSLGVSDLLRSSASRESRLREVSCRVAGCRRCALYQGRKNVVVGEGSVNATLLFVGEAPGGEEDRLGRPFVGRAGGLLTKIIEAMGMKREEVYITNCLKCRPPGNRNPGYDEILACRPYLEEQLDIIKPKVICALGKFAIQAFLNEKVSITELRGKFYRFGEILVMPTFHPAYLLRNPEAKRLVWEDMKKIMRELKR